MAISPIGNITYINQNMQTTSTLHANALQRGDMIPQEFAEQLQEIAEVRPTEKNTAVDKDAKGRQQGGFAQNEGEEDSRKEEEKQEGKEAQKEMKTGEGGESFKEGHLLNITV